MDLDSRGSTGGQGGSFWEGSATSDESNYLNAAFIVTGVMRSWWIRTSTEQTAEPQQFYVFTILVAEEKGGREDSMGLYFETADSKAVASGRNSYRLLWNYGRLVLL